MDKLSRARAHVITANEAYVQFCAAMNAFQVELTRHDEEAQERERERAVVALEDYFDNLSLADRANRG